MMTNDMLKIKALCRARTNEEAAEIINRKDDDAPKQSPALATACLAQSILTGDVAALRKCFENGADPNAIIAGDDNPLFFRAVSTGNIEMVNAFLDAGAYLMMMDRNNGFSAMNAAVMSRDKGMVLFIIAKMLEEGADYYCLLQEALFTAVYNDDADMAEYFLGAGQTRMVIPGSAAGFIHHF